MMCSSKFKFGYFSALSLLLMTLAAAPARAGIEANNFSIQNDISLDGRFVVFESIANNLVPGDTNGNNDIFFLNRASGVITRLSVNNSAVQGNNPSVGPKISPDGRYVVFSSIASNFGADTNGVEDIFLRDMQTNTISLISVATGGTQGNSGSFDSDVSDDGRYVVFQSNASNLVAGDTNGVSDIFVRDTVGLTTTRVSVSTAGTQGNGLSNGPGISSDGSNVVYSSAASNLVAGDTNTADDVFVRNTLTNITARVSLSNIGTQGSGASLVSAISGDGRYVTFESGAADLVVGDTNSATDIFVRDTQLNATVRVNVSSAGVQANNTSTRPALSGDGRYVTFASSADNLVAGDTNSDGDVFRRDLQTNTTSRASVSSGGAQSNGFSDFAQISVDGRYIVFRSIASNLGVGDTNTVPDTFVRDNLTQATTRVNVLPDTAANLQALYQCDANALDTSGAARNLGPSFGTLTFAADGRFDRACQFDGFTQVKSVNSAFTQSNNVTYAFWMKQSAPRTGQETIMQTQTGTATSNIVNSIDFQTSPARLRFWGDNLSPFTTSSASTPTLFDSTWHHVAITSTGTNSSVKMYIDGADVPVSVSGTNSVTDLKTTFYLGTRSDLLPSNLENFLGAMDDVRIYSRALTPFDVLDLTAPPGIGDVADVTINEDVTIGPISFSVNDLQTSASSLQVVASSSNPTLVPLPNITLGGTGSARTVSVLPAFNQSGTSTITLTVTDDDFKTSNVNFILTVNPVNDVPVFTAGPNQSVFEDAGPQSIPNWASAIDDGDPDAVQTLNFVVTPLSGTVNFSVFPTISPSGTLSYTSAPDSVGSATFSVQLNDNGGTANGGVNQSTLQNFTISVGPVNDAPSFTAGPNQTVFEDAGPQSISGWATAIDDGEPVAVQTLNFIVTPLSGTVNFSVFPTVSPSGTLSYTSAPDSVGSASFSVQLNDNGGTANGGVNQSAPQTFTISVGEVNDAPTFTPGANQGGLEDSGPQSIANWATAIDDGDAAQVQALNFVVTPISSVDLTFSVLPTISPSGTLSYTTALDSNGFATFSVRLDDNGGTANGGVDQSATQTFTISASPVNDAPTFTAGANQSVLEDAGAQSIPNWATAIDAHDPEVFQSVTFVVTPISGTLNFSAFPTVSPTGTLSYTSAPDSFGIATFSVRLDDDGGNANGGVNQSALQNFTINVGPVNDAPIIAALSNVSTNEDTATTPIAITLGDLDGPVAGLTLSATSSNPSLVPVGNVVFGGSGASRTLVITPDPDTSGTASITVTVSDGMDTSSSTFLLTVNPVNDAPTFNPFGGIFVLEDTASGANAIIVSDIDSPVGGLTLSATSSNVVLAPVVNIVFGGSGANRTVNITPAPDQSGTSSIIMTVSDGADSSATTFTFSVLAVNDPPSFAVGANQSLLFANNTAQSISNWATAITDGDPDFVQALSLSVSNNNNALFTVQPSVAANGTLSYTALGTPGTANVSVSVTDDGSAGGPGPLTSSVQNFSITVAPNTAPSISAVSAQSTNEDTAAAIAFTVSDIETPATGLTVTTLSSNTTLIPLANILAAGAGSNRSLSITPSANLSGTSTITINVSDGTDISARSFALTVNPVNDLPSFTKGADQVIAPGISGAQSISNWATAIEDGDADFPQTLSFNLSSNNPGLFSSPPSVTAAGTLSFTPAVPAVAGIATVSISLTDDGSAGGSALTTALQSFTIIIQAVPVVSVEQRTPISTVVGQPFTVRVRVRNPTGNLVPTGTVSAVPLPVGATVQCSLSAIASPPGSAEAICANVISPIASAKLVLAVYGGNPVFVSSDANEVHPVDKAGTLLRILEDLPDPSPSNTPVAVRYQLEVLAPSLAPLSSLNGIITLSDGNNQTSAPFSLSNPVISLVLQGDGPRVLTARYSSDSNFLDSSATEAHTLTGGNSTDLAVTVSNGKGYVLGGGEAVYLIRVRNLGGINSSAQLNAFVPEGLSNYRYTCAASVGSSCHAANGTGAVIAAINVAAGGEVTYTVRADVIAAEAMSVSHTARIIPATSPPDTDASNDFATDTDFVALFVDGFEN